MQVLLNYSRHSDSLRAWKFGARTPMGPRDSLASILVQISPPPASCTRSTAAISRGQSGRWVTLNTHPHLALPMAPYGVMFTFTYWLILHFSTCVRSCITTIKIRTEFNLCLCKIKFALRIRLIFNFLLLYVLPYLYIPLKIFQQL
jgi:hypothetical protein